MPRGLIKLTPYNVELGIYSYMTVDARPDQGLPGQPPFPDQGLPGQPPFPDQGLPRPPGHPSHPIVIPPVPPTPGEPPQPSHPIVLPPAGPSGLPPGSGIVVPLPTDIPRPTPHPGTPLDYLPYVLWFGPGSQSSVVWLPPTAQPKY